MNPHPTISDSEWKVLDLLWKKSPQTSAELILALEKESQWSDSTIKTLLTRLIKKGAVAFEKKGHLYLYRPLLSEKIIKSQACKGFLDKIFGGSVTPLLQHFVESNSLSPTELESLQKLINRKSKR